MTTETTNYVFLMAKATDLNTDAARQIAGGGPVYMATLQVPEGINSRFIGDYCYPAFLALTEKIDGFDLEDLRKDPRT